MSLTMNSRYLSTTWKPSYEQIIDTHNRNIHVDKLMFGAYGSIIPSTGMAGPENQEIDMVDVNITDEGPGTSSYKFYGVPSTYTDTPRSLKFSLNGHYIYLGLSSQFGSSVTYDGISYDYYFYVCRVQPEHAPAFYYLSRTSSSSDTSVQPASDEFDLYCLDTFNGETVRRKLGRFGNSFSVVASSSSGTLIMNADCIIF